MSRLTRLRSEPPLVLRPAPGPLVHLLGGAAGPLGGDELHLDIAVGPGAHLAVRGVAATLALPGVEPGRPARLTVCATLASGACLDWAPEPVIVAHRARLELDTEIRVESGDGTRLRWCDELVLGRTGEPPGAVVARTRLVVDGRPALDHTTTAGGDPPGPGGLAGHRWLGSALHLGAGPPVPTAPVADRHVRAASLVLRDGSWLFAATAVDRRTGLAQLGSWGGCGPMRATSAPRTSLSTG